MLYFRYILLCILLLGIPVLVCAQSKTMAVIDVQVRGDAKKFITPEERVFLSNVIRGQASQLLGGAMEILSKAKYLKLVKANPEGCSQAGCFAGFVQELGVDYGMQPTVTLAFGSLQMSLEVADQKSIVAGRILTVPTTAAEINIWGDQVEQTAHELFLEVAARLGNVPGLVPVVISDPVIADSSEEMGEINTFLFPIAKGWVRIDQQLICSGVSRCSKEISKGRHFVEVGCGKTADSSFVLKIPSKDHYLSFDYEKIQGYLKISVKDSQNGEDLQATILVDGVPFGVTPWLGPLPLHAKLVFIQKSGYDPRQEVLERPSPGDTLSVLYKLTSSKAK